MAVGDGFELWSGISGVHVVESPVRRQILHALGDGPKRLADLGALTGRAKSTLSGVHLRQLVQLGLVSEKRDATDTRVVLYHLTGRAVARSQPGEGLQAATATLGDVWRIVAPGQAAQATTAARLLRHLARQVAAEWSKLLRSTQLPHLLRELGERLASVGLGGISDVSPKGLSFRVTGFTTGGELDFFRQVVEALVEEKAGRRVRIVQDFGVRRFRVEPAR